MHLCHTPPLDDFTALAWHTLFLVSSGARRISPLDDFSPPILLEHFEGPVTHCSRADIFYT